MQTATYIEMTNTYRVNNDDGTFDTYTPGQYIEKFGALPEAVEDVTDVVEEDAGEGDQGPVGEVVEPEAPVEPEVPETITDPEAIAEAQAEVSEMVNFTVTEESLETLNADLPEGKTPVVVGDSVSLAKNHPLLDTGAIELEVTNTQN